MGSNWVYNPYRMDSDGLDPKQAINDHGGHLVRQEIAINGGIQSHTPYVPYEGLEDKPGDYEELMGGFRESNGTCERCFQIRAANGECGC